MVKHGSWIPYFERFPFADRPADHPLFDLVPPVAELGIPHTVCAATFGKWVPELVALTGPTPEVVSAACAGSNDTNHRRALDAMALYAPQVTVT